MQQPLNKQKSHKYKQKESQQLLITKDNNLYNKQDKLVLWLCNLKYNQYNQEKKTQIGQPGVSRTRVSSGIGIGGYGGTGAGNVNPTGLNI
jgi:hypothetical protein